ncbi:MAG: DUF1572 family protein [Mariniblastus sp.]
MGRLFFTLKLGDKTAGYRNANLDSENGKVVKKRVDFIITDAIILTTIHTIHHNPRHFVSRQSRPEIMSDFQQSNSAPPRYPQSQVSDEFSRLNDDLLNQSLAKIRHCFNQLNESQIWWRPEPSMNSIGNLVIHLAGNLRQWGVVPFTMATDRRDRESEFQNDVRMSSDELMKLLTTVVGEAKEEWKHLAQGQLLRPVDIQGFEVNHMHAILHASSHFVGHTHQIIQMTRLQLGNSYQFHWKPNDERGELPI